MVVERSVSLHGIGLASIGPMCTVSASFPLGSGAFKSRNPSLFQEGNLGGIPVFRRHPRSD